MTARGQRGLPHKQAAPFTCLSGLNINQKSLSYIQNSWFAMRMNLHIVSLIVGVGFQWKSDTSEPLWLFMSSASLKISLHNMCTANSVTSVLVSRFFKNRLQSDSRVVLGVFKVLSICLECSYKPLVLPNPQKFQYCGVSTIIFGSLSPGRCWALC